MTGPKCCLCEGARTRPGQRHQPQRGGQPEPQPWVIPRSDTSWFRGSFADNFERGDVIHVRRMTDGEGSEGKLTEISRRPISDDVAVTRVDAQGPATRVSLLTQL